MVFICFIYLFLFLEPNKDGQAGQGGERDVLGMYENQEYFRKLIFWGRVSSLMNRFMCKFQLN